MNLSDPAIATILTIWVALFGLIVGSFFNVVIWRLPRKESIISPGSHCPSCNRPVKPFENIPLLSFIFLGGRCRGCKAKISIRYPLIELLTALLALVVWKWYVPGRITGITEWWQMIPLLLELLALLALVPIFFIDLEHFIIPDSITLPLLGAGILASFIPGPITPLEMVLGLFCGGGLLYTIGFIAEVILKKGEAMGGGDIKLMAMTGVIFGWKMSLLAIVFGSFLGAAIGLAAIKYLPKDHRIPFGPFLACGLLTALFYGNSVLRWYLGLF